MEFFSYIHILLKDVLQHAWVKKMWTMQKKSFFMYRDFIKDEYNSKF